MTVRVGRRSREPTPLEHFVTARWGLHTRAWGRTLHLPNEHPRWPLYRAELLELDDELIAAAGCRRRTARRPACCTPRGAGRFGAPDRVP